MTTATAHPATADVASADRVAEEIRPGQLWLGKHADTTIEIVSGDSARPGRWIVLLHNMMVKASFDEDVIRGRYDRINVIER